MCLNPHHLGKINSCFIFYALCSFTLFFFTLLIDSVLKRADQVVFTSRLAMHSSILPHLVIFFIRSLMASVPWPLMTIFQSMRFAISAIFHTTYHALSLKLSPFGFSEAVFSWSPSAVNFCLPEDLSSYSFHTFYT